MKSFYKKRNYKEALKDCRTLVSLYPNSRCAMECLYFYGKSLMQMGKYYRAYLKFQELLLKYPSFEKKEEIIGIQVEIGNYFFYKKSSRFFSFSFKYEYAIKIFQSVVCGELYGAHSEYAQFHLAESYRLFQDYQSALNCYKLLIDHFPEGIYYAETLFKIALTETLLTKSSLYGDSNFEKSLLKFEKYIKNNQKMPRFDVVKKEVNLLKNQMSNKIFGIASYYERQKKYKSALLYYEEFYQKYSHQSKGSLVKKKIIALRKKIEKMSQEKNKK